MKHLLLRWLGNALAIYIAVLLLPGLRFGGDFLELLGVAAVFGLLNALIRPVLTLLSCPLIVLTLGLFTLVINAVMLLLTSSAAGTLGLDFHVDGFWWAFWGGLIIGLVSTVLTLFIGDRQKTSDRL